MRNAKTRRGNQILASAAGAAVAVLAASQANAASGNWVPTATGTHQWTDNNWTASPYPNGAGESATITSALTGNQTINLGTSVTLASLSIGGNGTASYTYTLSSSTGRTITMDNGTSNATITKINPTNSSAKATDTISTDIILNSNLAITNSLNNASNGLTLAGAIKGSKSLTLNNTGINAGFFTLSNTDSSYTGTTTIERGVLSFASIKDVNGGNSSLGAPTTPENGTIKLGSGGNGVTFAYTGTVAVSTNRVLDFAGTSGTVILIGSSATATVTYTSPFTYSGGTASKTLAIYRVIIESAITNTGLSLETGSNTGGGYDSSLLGLNTYRGTTTVKRGVLTINSIADYGTATPTSLGSPQTEDNAKIKFTGGSSTGVTGTLRYTGSGHSSNRPMEMIDSGSSTSGAVLDVSGTGNLTLTGNLSNTGDTSKTVTLQGSNTGQGEFGGVISDRSSTYTTSVTKSGTGTWTLSGANTYTGATTVSGGTLALKNVNAVQSSTLDTSTSSATKQVTFTVSGTNTYNIGGLTGSNALAIDGNTISVGAKNTDTSFGADISGTNGGLTKVGTAKLTLTAATSYTGTTKVARGTLALGASGTIAGSSGLVLGDSTAGTTGTLDVTAKTSPFSISNVSGNGTLNISNTNTKTITLTGTLAPGFSLGQVDVTGNLALGSNTDMEVAATNAADLVNVTGSITYGGALAITGYSGFNIAGQAGSYNLFDFTGADNGQFGTVSVGGTTLNYNSGPNTWTGVNGPASYSFAMATGDLTVVVPEPGSAASLLAAGALMALRRKKRN
ncbi:MAG: autotransporter-associated beta strand repeat-containing protein [Planctomycetia bacterium]|nr:autotransporter-associated beta strand repeat-containing protein [Planctomycetia bacterium]